MRLTGQKTSPKESLASHSMTEENGLFFRGYFQPGHLLFKLCLCFPDPPSDQVHLDALVRRCWNTSASPALSTSVSSSSFCSTPKQPTHCQGNSETDGIGNNPRKAEGRFLSVFAYWKLYRWRCICYFKNLHCQSQPNKPQAFVKSMLWSFMWKVDYLCYNACDNLSYLTFIWLLIWDFGADVKTLFMKCFNCPFQLASNRNCRPSHNKKRS